MILFRNIVLVFAVAAYSILATGSSGFPPSREYYAKARAALDEIQQNYIEDKYQRVYSLAQSFAAKFGRSAYVPSVLWLGLEAARSTASGTGPLLKFLNGFSGFGKKQLLSLKPASGLKSYGTGRKYIFLGLPGVAVQERYLIKNGFCRSTDCGYYAVNPEVRALLRYPEKYLARYFSPVFPEAKIVFSGSGNYHHLAYFLVKNFKSESKFTVVIFDAHTDYRTGGEGVFDCGSWVGRLLNLDKVRKVVQIGTNTSMHCRWENISYRFPADAEIHQDGQSSRIYEGGFRMRKLGSINDPPDIPTRDVYVSLDLDALSYDYINTDWGNGNVSAAKLIEVLNGIKKSHRIIGADICALTAYPDGKSLATLLRVASALRNDEH